MIHTAQFYSYLNKEEIETIQNRYHEEVNLVSEKINNIYKEKGITTTFYRSYGVDYISLEIDFIKLLNKSDIVEDDYTKIHEKIKQFLIDVIGYEIELYMIRLDYRLDIEVKNKVDRQFLIDVLNKSISKYRFHKKYNKYKTCKYFNCKSIQFKIYDKEQERICKGKSIEEYEENVLRLEIALRNRHLNYKKYIGRKKELKSYLNNLLYVKYFRDMLKNIIYTGDFMKIYKADKILLESGIKEKEKTIVREFLIDVAKHMNMDQVLSMVDKNGNIKYTKYKYKKIIGILEKLDINPILIPKNLKGASSIIKNPLKYLEE